MAFLKTKDLKAMKEKEIESKIKELKFELARGNASANKANAKTKELKRALARLYTVEKIKFNESRKEELIKT